MANQSVAVLSPALSPETPSSGTGGEVSLDGFLPRTESATVDESSVLPTGPHVDDQVSVSFALPFTYFVIFCLCEQRAQHSQSPTASTPEEGQTETRSGRRARGRDAARVGVSAAHRGGLYKHGPATGAEGDFLVRTFLTCVDSSSFRATERHATQTKTRRA